MELFNVIFKGKITQDKDIKTVKKSLQKTFRLNSQDVEKLFGGQKFKLKKNMERVPAEKFINSLEKIGAVAELEKVSLNQTPSGPSVKNVTQYERIHKCPSLEILLLKPNDIFIKFIGYNILLYLLIGLYYVPNMLFGYMLKHVQINGQALKLKERITYLKPLFYFLLISGISLFIFAIIGNIGQALEKAGSHQGINIIFIILALVPLAILFVSPGIGFLILLQSLLDSTEFNNSKICNPIYSDMKGIIKFIRSNWWTICRWSIAAFPVVLFPAWPPFWARITYEWFNRIELDGYQFNFVLPPKIVYKHVEFAIFTLGLSGFFFIGHLFNNLISRGEWVSVK